MPQKASRDVPSNRFTGGDAIARGRHRLGLDMPWV